ncbi:MAG: hypothetical protein JRD89_02210 [Deltaproteobacteria bacterium]|nr:hypothetical protein [Deltaproteobacteria bacterium]
MAEDEKATASPPPDPVAPPPDPEPVTPPPASASDCEKAVDPDPIGVPLDILVRYGTTTSKHDQAVAEQLAESRRRRAEDDAEKRIANEHGIQRGDPSSVATRYSNQFTDNPEIARAYVPLTYVTRSGREVTHRGVGDIIMVQDPAFENELALILFCPSCIEKAGLPPDQSLVTVRQSNRNWYLDRRTAGELSVFEDGTTFRTAGVIMESELFTCARCSWRARIDHNKVWPA